MRVAFGICLLLLQYVLKGAYGITFDVGSTKTRCVIDVLAKDDLVTGELSTLLQVPD